MQYNEREQRTLSDITKDIPQIVITNIMTFSKRFHRVARIEQLGERQADNPEVCGSKLVLSSETQNPYRFAIAIGTKHDLHYSVVSLTMKLT